MAASNTQLQAQIQELNRRLTAIASAMAPLTSSRISFLSGLNELPHQTTSNSSISTTAGSLSTSDRNAINGVIQAVNNLMAGLQSDGYQS